MAYDSQHNRVSEEWKFVLYAILAHGMLGPPTTEK